MDPYIDWNVEADRNNIRTGAISLRARNAEKLYMPIFATQDRAKQYLSSPRTYWRLKVLDKFAVHTRYPISGRVMEIGQIDIADLGDGPLARG